MAMNSLESFGAALRIIDDVWAVLRANTLYGGDANAPVQLPDIGPAATARRAARGRDLLERCAAIDTRSLPLDLSDTLEMARQTAERWSRERIGIGSSSIRSASAFMRCSRRPPIAAAIF